MEIIVHTIQDLNRFLNLGIYLLVDADKIMLNSLTLGKNLLEFNSDQTLELYQSMVELKRLLTSWSVNSSVGKTNQAEYLRGQISLAYKFDIKQHYHPKKYGKF